MGQNLIYHQLYLNVNEASHLWCITIGGSVMDVDSSSELTVIPFNILHMASIYVPCIAMVDIIDGRRWSLGLHSLSIIDGSPYDASHWSSMIVRPSIDSLDDGLLKGTLHVQA